MSDGAMRPKIVGNLVAPQKLMLSKDERQIEMSIGLARFPYVRDLAGFDFAAALD